LEKEPEQLQPMFVTELQLQPMQLQFSPDEYEFQDGIAEVIAAFQQTSAQNANLVSDSYFNAFTRLANPVSRMLL